MTSSRRGGGDYGEATFAGKTFSLVFLYVRDHPRVPVSAPPPPQLSVSPRLFTFSKCSSTYPVKYPAHVKRERRQSQRPPVGAANPGTAFLFQRIPLPVAPSTTLRRGRPQRSWRASCHRKASGDGGGGRDPSNGGGHVDGFEVKHNGGGGGV